MKLYGAARHLAWGAFLTALASTALAAGGQLGAPRIDSDAETTWRRVSWRDFKGNPQKPPGWNRWSRGSYAHILTFLNIGGYEIATRQVTREDGGSEWLAEPLEVRPYAVMDKYHSAVKTGSRNDVTLAHEQLHFDLAEAVARALAVEMARLEGRGDFAEDAEAELEDRLEERFARGREELEELQRSYDGETRNGQDRRQQKRWSAKIDAMLKEATAALIVYLETGSPPPEAPESGAGVE